MIDERKYIRKPEKCIGCIESCPQYITELYSNPCPRYKGGCFWKITSDDRYTSTCGQEGSVWEDNPFGWSYCPYCGKKIIIKEEY